MNQLKAKTLFTALVTSLSFSVAHSDTGKSIIANLEGCFSVVYKFTESSQYEKEIKDVFEEIVAVPQTDGSIFLQHYGIQLGEKMLHWSESWSQLADGNWQQIVRGPDGGFRYQCSAPFVFNQYRCTVKDAPKPNRDRNRTDYETLDREITLQITDKSWIQAESNVKRDKNKVAVANEVGWIEYRKVDPKNCAEI